MSSRTLKILSMVSKSVNTEDLELLEQDVVLADLGSADVLGCTEINSVHGGYSESSNLQNFISNASDVDFILVNEAVTADEGILSTATKNKEPRIVADVLEPLESINMIYQNNQLLMLEEESQNSDLDYTLKNDQNLNSDDSEIEEAFTETEVNHENNAIEIEDEDLHLEEAASGRNRKKIKCEKDFKRWKRNKNQRMRELGQEYYGKRKIEETWKYDIKKSTKVLKPPCVCKLSENKNCILQCRSINEDSRKAVFEAFWKLTWAEKKVFVQTLTNVRPTSRKRGAEDVSRRSTSTEFYLKNEGKLVRVCKKMFLQTLGLGEVAVKKWIRSSSSDIEKHVDEVEHRKDKEMSNLNAFFEILPKLESHYCRASSTKLYLEPIWESKAQLFKEYKNEFCKQNNIEPLSRATFSKRFDEMNLSLYRPKKDKCDVCVAFETNNLSETEYNIHIALKEEARSEKAKDKLSTNEVFTMDLEAVLLCPKSNVSSLYYKTKLVVHNFTIYDLKRLQGYCYLWNESEGTLTANEFSSIIVHFLSNFIAGHPSDDNVEYILYSDGCNYQNRNATLSNALFNFAIQKRVTIMQKYLHKGHTQMEADSMHSTIERKIRKKNINVPADYVNICKSACHKSPYSVEYLHHQFFKHIERSIKFFPSIRPGRKTGDPMVTDIKALKYTKDGVFYKLRHSDLEWTELPARINPKTESVPFESMATLHNERLKIKKEKFEHLQQLKRSLEPDYHAFYDNLPHF